MSFALDLALASIDFGTGFAAPHLTAIDVLDRLRTLTPDVGMTGALCGSLSSLQREDDTEP